VSRTRIVLTSLAPQEVPGLDCLSEASVRGLGGCLWQALPTLRPPDTLGLFSQPSAGAWPDK
jgi:hypothetical protein